jgi:hypothetical protein
MSALRLASLRIYIEHSLSSAIFVKTNLCRRLCTTGDTIAYLEQWESLCRRALTSCGTYDLAAVDRAEECVRNSMLVALTYIKEEQERHENLAAVLHRSATCYENARDKSTVSENALLWCCAAGAYDT